ncbi:hypothetical protein [[Clostridium] innocuum]|uniref:hypothetical protein n=1 Tax=Clostridium innocuum TaxID=1522 RepID=UPI001F05CE2A|nr:hypothetical protein [[Clostridium] innocuum]MCH1943028.1 hypothetical protein [[Clostridium] innocuum]MCH1953910.1 hypothetical protein [[Clostridium] innocuum]
MAFRGMVITYDGQSLLTQTQISKQFAVKCIRIGDGKYSADHHDIHSMVNPLYDVVPEIQHKDNQLLIEADITSNDHSGYYLREIGIIATDASGKEVLYAYDNAGNDAEYISPVDSGIAYEKRLRFALSITDDITINVQINGSVYALQRDLVQHVNDQTNPHNVTVEQLGLDNVDNTADKDKPISDATQKALDGKEPVFSKNAAFNKAFGNTAGTVCQGNDNRLSDARKNPAALTFTGGVTGSYDGSIAKSVYIPTSLPASDVYDWAKQPNKPSYIKSEVGLSNVDNTSDKDKPISDATKKALDGKEPVFSKNSAFNKAFGNTAGTVCQGNDSRLSDERTPKLHNHSRSDITDFPTSLPASDVYDWAKAVVKPIYEYGEITGNPPFSNPNLLDNGDFQVWQRGNSFDITERRKYTADRWVAYMNPEEGYVPYTVVNSSRRLKIVSATGGSRFLVYQHKELNNSIIRKILGKKLTLSVKMISGNAQEITTSATVLYNSSDKTSVLLARKAHMISANEYKIMSMTFDIAGDIDFDDVKSLQIIIASAGISSDVYIDYAKLELGEIATPDVPRTYAEERMICKRFGRYICVDFTMNAASNSFSNMMSIPVDMRIAPTLTLSAEGSLTTNITSERITYTSYIDRILFSFTASVSGMIRVYGRKYWADAEIY